MGTGGVMDLTSDFNVQELSEEQMAKAVEVAHRARKRVMVHAEGTEGIKAAVRAGVDWIEHGTMLDDEGAALMERKAHGSSRRSTLSSTGSKSVAVSARNDQPSEGQGDFVASTARLYSGIEGTYQDRGGIGRFTGRFAEGSGGARTWRDDAVTGVTGRNNQWR